MKAGNLSTDVHSIHSRTLGLSINPLVPTIDIGPYLTDSTSSEAGYVVDAIRNACMKTGFFQITGHGIPKNIQDEAIEAAKRFFSLPLNEKEDLDIKKCIGFRGYDGIGTQSYSASLAPDLKESFFIGTDVSMDDPRVQAGRVMTGPNVWPDSSVLPKSHFQEPIETYYAAMRQLISRVMEIIGRSWASDPEQFRSFLSNQPAAPLRLLHYPARPREFLDFANPQAKLEHAKEQTSQFGCGAHTDFGAITLLLQDGSPGLQLLNQETNQWFTIPPRPSAYVVNVGDMLSSITGGKYRSSWHRVLEQKGRDRYSIALFMHGNLDYVLNPVDGSNQEASLTVEEYLKQRIHATYARGRVSKSDDNSKPGQ